MCLARHVRSDPSVSCAFILYFFVLVKNKNAPFQFAILVSALYESLHKSLWTPKSLYLRILYLHVHPVQWHGIESIVCVVFLFYYALNYG